MKHWVYGYALVDGPPERLSVALREGIRDLLREVTGAPAGPLAVDGSFLLRIQSGPAGAAPTKSVRATTGVATESGRRVRIPLSWHAQPGRHAFPSFDGSIELEPLSDRHAQLTIVGSYSVPLGVIGAAFDGLGLGSVAERTIADLARALAGRLEEFVAEGEPAAAEPVSPHPVRLRVRDVMTHDPMVFEESLSLRSAALLLVYRGVHGAPVVSEGGDLVGVMSEHDLLEKEAAFRPFVGRGAKERERRLRALTVGQACSRPARVTVPEATLRDAARSMLDHGTARLVVVDRSAIAGIVTRHDVIKALLRSDAELQTAVDAVIGALREPEVRATVFWGEVSVEGVASVRSKVPHVVRLLSEIDGVVAVHGEPTWRDDDVTATVYGRRAV